MMRWKEYLGNNWFQLGYIKSVLADKSKLIMHIRGQQRKKNCKQLNQHYQVKYIVIHVNLPCSFITVNRFVINRCLILHHEQKVKNPLLSFCKS